MLFSQGWIAGLSLEPTMFAAMLLLLFAAIAIASSLFWIVMIVECATRESNHGNDKLIWILIIIFTHWIGALAYYFVRCPQRIAELGA
jgi:hypothetical protein